RLSAAHALRGENRTRRNGARLSPEVGRWGSFLKHRPFEGLSWCMAGRAENPRVVRIHLFRRIAQGRDAGGLKGPEGRVGGERSWNFALGNIALTSTGASSDAAPI